MKLLELKDSIKNLIIEVEDGIAVVTMNRPKANAIKKKPERRSFWKHKPSEIDTAIASIERPTARKNNVKMSKLSPPLRKIGNFDYSITAT